MLLVGTGLFARSLQNIRDIDLGYDIERVITVSAPRSPAANRLPELASIARSLPGVVSAALTDVMPLEGRNGVMLGTIFTPGGDTLRALGNQGAYLAVEPGYLATVGTRLIRGRDLSAADQFGSAPALVVSEEMARRVWPRQDPLGQCLRMPKRDGPCYMVVGIAGNAHGFWVVEEPSPVFYVTLAQSPDRPASGALRVGGLAVRVSGDPLPVASRLRAALGGNNGADSEHSVALMSDVLAPQYRPWQLGARLFAGFAVLALVLAALGLYSVLAYVVTVRRHELGVRLALGASRGKLMRLIIGDGLRHVVIGVGAGAVLVIAGSGVVSSFLYEVSPRDPAVISAAMALLIVSACGAAMLPARRAARVDPVTALREE